MAPPIPNAAPSSLPGPAGDARLTAIEEALEEFFGAAEELGMPLLALRGARTAPRYRGTGDLDLACSEADRSRVERLLRTMLRVHGARVVSEHRAASMTQFQLHARRPGVGAAAHHHLCVDLHTAETCFGVPYLRAEDLRRSDEGARFPDGPDAAHGALLDFLTPYLSGGQVNGEYAARLELVAEKNPAGLRALLGRLVGTKHADSMTEALRLGDHPALARHARGFRRALLARAFLRRPMASLTGAFHCAWAARIRPLFVPRGRVIALLGTDGTGKTSLGEALHEGLKGAFRAGESRIQKLRPGLLPQLGRFLGRKPTIEEFSRPHRAKPSGLVMTWVRASYYWLDYTLGYALRTLPLRRRNSLIIFDRWIDDWLVDPARYRMRAGSRYVALLARLAPRPDAVLVTSAPLRTVRERSQEVETRECLRQLEAYEAYAASRPHAHLISTAESHDATLRDAMDAILIGAVLDDEELEREGRIAA